MRDIRFILLALGLLPYRFPLFRINKGNCSQQLVDSGFEYKAFHWAPVAAWNINSMPLGPL